MMGYDRVLEECGWLVRGNRTLTHMGRADMRSGRAPALGWRPQGTVSRCWWRGHGCGTDREVTEVPCPCNFLEIHPPGWSLPEICPLRCWGKLCTGGVSLEALADQSARMRVSADLPAAAGRWAAQGQEACRWLRQGQQSWGQLGPSGAADGHVLREPGPEKLPVLRGLMKDHRSQERLPQTFLHLPLPPNLHTVSADKWKLGKGPTFIHFSVRNKLVTDTEQSCRTSEGPRGSGVKTPTWSLTGAWLSTGRPDTCRSKRDSAVILCPREDGLSGQPAYESVSGEEPIPHDITSSRLGFPARWADKASLLLKSVRGGFRIILQRTHRGEGS